MTSMSGHDGEEHPITAASKRLAAAADGGNCESVMEDIAQIASAVPGEAEGKTMAGNSGAIESAVRLLDAHKDDDKIATACLSLIELLITQNDLNRDKLKDPAAKPRISTVVETLNSFPDNATVQELGFKVARLASTKSEAIKVKM